MKTETLEACPNPRCDATADNGLQRNTCSIPGEWDIVMCKRCALQAPFVVWNALPRTPSPGLGVDEVAVRRDDIKNTLDRMKRAENHCGELEEALERLLGHWRAFTKDGWGDQAHAYYCLAKGAQDSWELAGYALEMAVYDPHQPAKEG